VLRRRGAEPGLARARHPTDASSTPWLLEIFTARRAWERSDHAMSGGPKAFLSLADWPADAAAVDPLRARMR
jgi:hypothetical protein